MWKHGFEDKGYQAKKGSDFWESGNKVGKL